LAVPQALAGGDTGFERTFSKFVAGDKDIENLAICVKRKLRNTNPAFWSNLASFLRSLFSF
jgi:hypothetical protein